MKSTVRDLWEVRGEKRWETTWEIGRDGDSVKSSRVHVVNRLFGSAQPQCPPRPITTG